VTNALAKRQAGIIPASRMKDEPLAALVIEGCLRFRKVLPYVMELKKRFAALKRGHANIAGCKTWKEFCEKKLDRTDSAVRKAIAIEKQTITRKLRELPSVREAAVSLQIEGVVNAKKPEVINQAYDHALTHHAGYPRTSPIPDKVRKELTAARDVLLAVAESEDIPAADIPSEQPIVPKEHATFLQTLEAGKKPCRICGEENREYHLGTHHATSSYTDYFKQHPEKVDLKTISVADQPALPAAKPEKTRLEQLFLFASRLYWGVAPEIREAEIRELADKLLDLMRLEPEVKA
jgi:hypothetical protein